MPSGWSATWSQFSNTSSVLYEFNWEAQWRRDSDTAGVWQSITPTGSGDQLTISGTAEPGEDLEVQIRGQMRYRRGNSSGWSGWSAWGNWSSWQSETDSCPALSLPSPTVTACRSSAGVEATWTIPPGTWATVTGWAIDVHGLDQNGQIISYLSAYSVSQFSLLPGSDSSIVLAVPAGTAVQVTVIAYDVGPPKLRGPDNSADQQDTAEATVESGCGTPTLPPAPAVPAPPAAPVPTGPVLVCVDDGSGGVTARASWTGQADTDAYAEAYQVEWSVDRGGTVTTLIRPTLSHYGDPPVELTSGGGLAAGDAVSVRVRAQAAARASATNSVGTTWSGWSSFGPWSTWSAASATSTCPSVAPVITPTPTAPCSRAAEPFTDANTNGVYDSGESFTDTNGNGQWDDALIAAVYPPGHADAGQPTGHCYPPGSPCLPPPNGTGAAGVLCIAKGS